MATFSINDTDIIHNVSNYNTQTGTVKKISRGFPPYTGTNERSGFITGTTVASLSLKRGAKNADFKRRRAAGEVVISPYYLKKAVYQGNTISGKASTFDGGGYRYDHSFSDIAPPTSLIQSLFAKTFYATSFADGHESQARTAASANVGKASFEMGVFLLEGKESARMLMDRYDKLIRIVIRTVKQAKQKSRTPGDWMRYFADLWVRQRYGVEPLLKDLEDLINLDKPKPKIREISLGNSVPTESSVSFSHSYSSSNALTWVDFRLVGLERVTTSCKVGVFADYTVHNPLWWLCRDLGISTPASILLEVTRLSFVVDWFINLSEYIKSFELRAGVNVTDAWAHIRVRYELELYAMYDCGAAGVGQLKDQAGGSMGKITLSEHVRNRTSTTVPLLPEIRVKLNALKILDSVALLTQAIKK